MSEECAQNKKCEGNFSARQAAALRRLAAD